MAFTPNDGASFTVGTDPVSKLFALGEPVTLALSAPAGATCAFDAATGVTVSGDGREAELTPTGEVGLGVTCATAATETCNGDDDDHDGSTDEGFDTDADGVTTCGPDGVTGNADDDCNDTDGTINPNATEVCNGLDDDCANGPESADADGDGVPDVCDDHPSATCPAFDLADVQDVLAQPGAVCLVDVTSTDMEWPDVLDGSADTITGAFVDYGADAFELAAALLNGTDTFAALGCTQPNVTGPCTDASRPTLPAGSEVDPADYPACHDIAAYACETSAR